MHMLQRSTRAPLQLAADGDQHGALEERIFSHARSGLQGPDRPTHCAKRGFMTVALASPPSPPVRLLPMADTKWRERSWTSKQEGQQR